MPSNNRSSGRGGGRRRQQRDRDSSSSSRTAAAAAASSSASASSLSSSNPFAPLFAVSAGDGAGGNAPLPLPIPLFPFGPLAAAAAASSSSGGGGGGTTTTTSTNAAAAAAAAATGTPTSNNNNNNQDDDDDDDDEDYDEDDDDEYYDEDEDYGDEDEDEEEVMEHFRAMSEFERMMMMASGGVGDIPSFGGMGMGMGMGIGPGGGGMGGGMGSFESMMAHLAMSMAGGVVMGDEEDEEEEEDPNVKCPVCALIHPPLLLLPEAEEEGTSNKKRSHHSSQKTTKGRKQQTRGDPRNIPNIDHHCSHGATMAFLELDQCPVCMEEKIQPAIVLACGHAICPSDFERLGGKVGPPEQEESDDDDEEEEEEIHECCPHCTRERRERERTQGRAQEFFRMIDGLAAESSAAAAASRRGDDGDGDDEDSEDDEPPPLIERSVSVEPPNSSTTAAASAITPNATPASTIPPNITAWSNLNMGPLVSTGNPTASPAAETTTTTNPPVSTLRGGNNRRNNNNNNRTNNNNSNNASSNTNAGRDTSTTSSSRTTGTATSSSTSNNRMASGSGGTGGGGDDDSSDDDGPPPLAPRGGLESDSEDDEEESNNDDDDDGDDGPPPLSARSRTATSAATDDDDDDDSDGSLPPLMLRNDNSDSDDDESDDDDGPPPLLGRNAAGASSSNNSNTRRNVNNNNNNHDDDDDDDDSDDDLPPLARRQDVDTDSEDDDDDDDSFVYNNNNPNRNRNRNADDSDDDDSLPALLERNEANDSSDEDNSDKEDEGKVDEDDGYLPRLIPPRRKETHARLIIFKRVLAWSQGYPLRQEFQTKRASALRIQSTLRMWRVQQEWKARVQERIEAHRRHVRIWGSVLKALPPKTNNSVSLASASASASSKIAPNNTVTWARIKVDRFDTRRQTALGNADDGNDDDDNEDAAALNEHALTMDRLDTAIQHALQTMQEQQENNNNSADDLQLSIDALEQLDKDDDDEALTNGAPRLKDQALQVETRPKCDHIQLTKDVLKWLDRQDSKYRGLFLRRISQLANGERSRILQKNLTGCKTTIWETYLDQKSGQRILWTEYRQEEQYGILIWYVAKHDNVSRLLRLIDEAEHRSQRQWKSADLLFDDGNAAAAPGAAQQQQQGTFETSLMHLDNSNQILPDPLGDVPLKLHVLTREELPKLANRHWKPRLSLTKEEQMCVQKPGTILLLGRSGTGKTVCIADRMEYERQQVRDTLGEQPFSQLFVARSFRICNYVQGLVDGGDQQANGDERFKTTYSTYSNLLRLCERQLGIANQFAHTERVDFARFRRETNFQTTMDPLIVWSQIRSFIKGSMEAIQAKRPLTKEEYMALGESRCRLSKELREQAFQAFESYQKMISSQGLWDDCDRIAALVAKLTSADFDVRQTLSYHKVYVDEIQDYTQAEIALFFLLSEPGGLFLAGDTAQSVVEGVEFRFEEVRSVGHLLFQGDRRYIPDKPLTVNRNFRSHSGILNVAAAVLERLFAAFPKSANKLDPDVGVFFGPRPGILYNLSREKLQELVARVEGVVLLTHDSKVPELQEQVGEHVMVLGIRESKGLEFPNIIVVDFFSGLASEHQKSWRQLLTIRENGRTENDIIPEVESQLKLLYTGVTRASKRLLFAETSPSTSGQAFVKWATFANDSKDRLAAKQAVTDVEQMTQTADEWLSAGVDFAMEAENAEDPQRAKKWLGFAIRNLEKGGEKHLLDKAKIHHASVVFRCDLEDDPSEDLDSIEKEAARVMDGLVKEKMYIEARKVCDALLPKLGGYTKQRLLSELETVISQEEES